MNKTRNHNSRRNRRPLFAEVLEARQLLSVSAQVFSVNGMALNSDGSVVAPLGGSDAGGMTITVTRGPGFTVDGRTVNGIVAHFAEDGPPNTDGESPVVQDHPPFAFAASIEWGDATMSAGVIAAGSHGGFDISASHTYPADGQFAIQLTVRETDAGFDSSTFVNTMATGQSLSSLNSIHSATIAFAANTTMKVAEIAAGTDSGTDDDSADSDSPARGDAAAATVPATAATVSHAPGAKASNGGDDADRGAEAQPVTSSSRVAASVKSADAASSTAKAGQPRQTNHFAQPAPDSDDTPNSDEANARGQDDPGVFEGEFAVVAANLPRHQKAPPGAFEKGYQAAGAGPRSLDLREVAVTSSPGKGLSFSGQRLETERRGTSSGNLQVAITDRGGEAAAATADPPPSSRASILRKSWYALAVLCVTTALDAFRWNSDDRETRLRSIVRRVFPPRQP